MKRDNCEQAILQLTDRKQLLLDQVKRIDNCIDTLQQVFGSGKEQAETKKTKRIYKRRKVKPPAKRDKLAGSRKTATGHIAGLRGPRKQASKYKGVSLTKMKADGTQKFRVQFWDGPKKRNIPLGAYESELEAAAVYQDYAGNKAEAQKLRALAKQQKSDMVEQADNNPDRPKAKKKMKEWRCKHCGLEVRHPTMPSIGCIQCNSSSYEQIK